MSVVTLSFVRSIWGFSVYVPKGASLGVLALFSEGREHLGLPISLSVLRPAWYFVPVLFTVSSDGGSIRPRAVVSLSFYAILCRNLVLYSFLFRGSAATTRVSPVLAWCPSGGSTCTSVTSSAIGE